jgi:histidyl-tRNA synthetase
MSKLTNISGFPEWTPAQKLVENSLMERIRKIYESHGFTPIETPAVELYSTLGAKGVVDKEIYALRRAQVAPEQSEPEMALHFDLTVPFARYVAQHLHELTFPFRRYQVQKVWRGDRPQRGRFREFYQFDLDVIAHEELPIAVDAEVISAFLKAVVALGIGTPILKCNNRKVLLGFYAGVGVPPEKQAEVIRCVDKLHKIGAPKVAEELRALGLESKAVEKIIESTQLTGGADDFNSLIAKVQVSDPVFEAGVAESAQILALIPEQQRQYLRFDLSLARGLDYYTGVVFELMIAGYEGIGSVGGGGRYDNLCGDFIRKKLPGMGASIGLTRLLDLGFSEGILKAEKPCPTNLLVTVYNEALRPACNKVADDLRNRDLAVEVFHKDSKLGKQIEYALAKQISLCFSCKKTFPWSLKTCNPKISVRWGVWKRSLRLF